MVSTDHPASVIDHLHRPILLLPNSVEHLSSIHNKVHAVDHVLMTPKWQEGELAHWSEQWDELTRVGFVLMEESGVELVETHECGIG